jgi:hypothetical protein
VSKDVLHVVPHNEAWAVKREGNERATSTHQTQRDAIESARNLATEGDDIVIHRPDGTIRERSTYMLTTEKSNGSKAAVQPSDVMSVGTRVSWGAVLAGAVVAITVYVTLTLLALAIGVTTIDRLAGRETEFAIGAAIVMTFALMASLFLGGYVASLTTAGENTRESIIFGVLVWGTMFGILLTIGSSLSLGMGSMLGPVNRTDNNSAFTSKDLQAKLELTPEQQQKYEQTIAEAQALTKKVEPVTLAWWGFATLVLSLLSAVGGSLSGAGPEFVFRRIFVPRGPSPAPSPV